jgi:hypothetical protein
MLNKAHLSSKHLEYDRKYTITAPDLEGSSMTDLVTDVIERRISGSDMNEQLRTVNGTPGKQHNENRSDIKSASMKREANFQSSKNLQAKKKRVFSGRVEDSSGPHASSKVPSRQVILNSTKDLMTVQSSRNLDNTIPSSLSALVPY